MEVTHRTVNELTCTKKAIGNTNRTFYKKEYTTRGISNTLVILVKHSKSKKKLVG
jgi:hypothetical protein